MTARGIRIRIVGPKSPDNRYGYGWTATLIGVPTGLGWHLDSWHESLADAWRFTDKLLRTLPTLQPRDISNVMRHRESPGHAC